MSHIAVRHVEASDYEAIAAIYATEAVIEQTTQIPYRTAEFWKNFYNHASPSNVELVALRESQVVGHLGILLNTNIRRKHVASFGIAVHPEHQKMGVGKALMAEMINLCDNWMNILRLELAVYSDNLGAIHLYKTFGFEVEGEARFECFRKGRFAHSTKMARFHPSFQSMLAGG